MLASLVTNKSAGRGSEITLRAEELLMNEGAGVKAVVAWAAKTAKAKERTNMMGMIVTMGGLSRYFSSIYGYKNSRFAEAASC